MSAAIALHQAGSASAAVWLARVAGWTLIAAAVVAGHVGMGNWADSGVGVPPATAVVTVAAVAGLAVALVRPPLGAALVLTVSAAEQARIYIAFTGNEAFAGAWLPSVATYVALYTVLRSPRRRRWPWLAAGSFLVVTGAAAQMPWVAEWVAVSLLNGMAGLAVLALLAEVTRRRRQEVAEIRARTLDLQRLRSLRAQAAVADERSRLARAAEEALSQNVQEMVARAREAPGWAARRPGEAAGVIAGIESAGRRCIDELRRLVRAEVGATQDHGQDPTGPRQAGSLTSPRSSGRPGRPTLDGTVVAAWIAVLTSVAASLLLTPELLELGDPMASTGPGDVGRPGWAPALQLGAELAAAAALGLMALRAVAGAVVAFGLIAILVVGDELAAGPDVQELSLPFLAACVALYAMLRRPYRRRWPWMVAGALLTAPLMGIAAAGMSMSTGPGTYDVVGVGSMVWPLVLAVALAEVSRRRLTHVANLQQHAEELRRVHELEMTTAVAAERARIAREMHDIVAHSVMAMVVQAGAARRAVSRRPDDARRALSAVVKAGEQALDELRHITGAVHSPDEGAPDPSRPAVAGLTDLVARWPGVATLLTTGTPRPTGPAVDLVAYRVVQEALTNVGKHAGAGAHALVLMAWGPTELEIVVTDNGGAQDNAPGEGFGLTGMSERVALAGGTLTAGPRRDGPGWRVHAVLPVPSAPSEVPARRTTQWHRPEVVTV